MSDAVRPIPASWQTPMEREEAEATGTQPIFSEDETMSKKKSNDPKSTPGLVTIRLQLTPDERDKLRAIAAVSAHKDMANLMRAVARDIIKKGGWKP